MKNRQGLQQHVHPKEVLSPKGNNNIQASLNDSLPRISQNSNRPNEQIVQNQSKSRIVAATPHNQPSGSLHTVNGRPLNSSFTGNANATSHLAHQTSSLEQYNHH